jgi:hypothetical protein
MSSRLLVGLGAVALVLGSSAGLGADSGNAKSYKAPRTLEGQPDLQGVWSNSTLTPVERSPAMGEQLVLSNEQASAMEKQMARMVEAADAPSDPGAPQRAGGDVGGYNLFWADLGTRVATVNGERRSSITVEPANGRLPSLTPKGKEAADARTARLASAGLDGPEVRMPGERCILGFGTNSGPPMLPVMYNSHFQIVQSKDTVVIQVEMVHDARVIHVNGKHPPASIRPWMGSSIGRWDGDSLVVETVNFHPQQVLSIGGGATYRTIPVTDQLKVTERFTRKDARTILYQFTVEDPGTFQGTWRGEMPLNLVDASIYEYACHEGNYALPGILAGAREEEKKAGEKQGEKKQ